MPHVSRQRYVEYHSPRSLILTLCFIWGIGVGFTLNFIVPRTADTGQDSIPAAAGVPRETQSVPSELERRRQDAPNIAEVAPAPASPASMRPTIEDIVLGPPSAVLTTEGGLTSRTASLPGVTPALVRTVPPTRQSLPPAPPPLPDLMP